MDFIKNLAGGKPSQAPIVAEDSGVFSLLPSPLNLAISYTDTV